VSIDGRRRRKEKRKKEERKKKERNKEIKKGNSIGIHSPTFGNYLYSATITFCLPVQRLSNIRHHRLTVITKTS
jgi:hypothetical protein